jgi:hypothetical protein
VIPYSPHIESEGSVVSFDGKIIKFGKVFDPLPGFTNFEALNALLQAASGKSYSLEAVRELIGVGLR